MLTSTSHIARPPSSASGQTTVSFQPLSFHSVSESLLRMGCWLSTEGRQLPAFSELPFRNGGTPTPGFSRGTSAAAGTRWAGSRHSFLNGSFSGPCMLALLEGANPEPLTTNANSLLPASPPVPMTD